MLQIYIAMEEEYLVILDKRATMVTPDIKFINANKFTNIDVINPGGGASDGYGLVYEKRGVKHS